VRAFVFNCRGKGVAPIFVVHAKCFDIAQREALHRFKRTWPEDEHKGAEIDISRADVEPADKYFRI